jgi:O-antigen/teichoic acid export membrane protein
MNAPTEDPAERYDQHLRRGALYNLLGLAAKLVHPLFFLVVTWFFGPDLVGLYFLAVSVGEIANSAVTAGFNEATTLFASRHADDPAAEGKLYAVLGDAFAITGGLSLVLMVGLYAGAGFIVEHWYADRPGLAGALRLLALSLPPAAVAQVAIASTKARMHMQYDALINGFVKPLTLLVCSILAKVLGLGLEGLIGAHVVMQTILAVMGVRAMAKHYSVRQVWHATLHPVWDREILRFAVPQTLNMTVTKYLTRVDMMLLGALGFSNWHLAFYSAAALITTNLREVKLIFSTALAPVAARHHARGDKAAFEEALGRLSRWTTAIAVPLVLVVAILRTDLLRFVDASYTQDSTFMVWLLVPPFLSCAFGLAGNCVVYTGHSGWNLFNSVLVGTLNTLLNWLMIPRWGLWGAAVATAIASSLVSGLQMVELYFLEKVRIRAAAVFKPHVALAVALAAFALLGDPALLPGFGYRLAAAGAVVAGYGLLMLALRLEELASVPVLRRLRFF